MRWSQYFIPTSKEIPRDATAASHILMLRSGMIRQVSAGVYGYLPLGYRDVKMRTLTNEVQVFPPKARVY